MELTAVWGSTGCPWMWRVVKFSQHAEYLEISLFHIFRWRLSSVGIKRTVPRRIVDASTLCSSDSVRRMGTSVAFNATMRASVSLDAVVVNLNLISRHLDEELKRGSKNTLLLLLESIDPPKMLLSSTAILRGSAPARVNHSFAARAHHLNIASDFRASVTLL